MKNRERESDTKTKHVEASLFAAQSSATDIPTGNYDHSIMIVTFVAVVLFFVIVFCDYKFTFGHSNFSVNLFNLKWRYARISGYLKLNDLVSK